MVDQYPKPYTTASPVLVNFDSAEVANGLSYEDYYLIESEDSGGKDYHLTPNRDFGNNDGILTKAGGSLDYDYDLSPFVIPRTINGLVRISIPIYVNDGSSIIVAVSIYKWDGSSETQLGSTASETKAISNAKMVYMMIDIDNELIPAGETLRARVVFTHAAGSTARMGIDPAGRTDASLSITTTSKISVPYKNDL